MMYRKSTALLLITLLVASSAAGLGFAGAQPVSTSQQVSGTLLSVLENSHGEVTSLFESVASDGGVSEDAQEAYDRAVQLWAQAQDEYDLGEYGEAVKTATKALNMYGRAAGKIFEEAEVEVEPEDDETKEYLGLFVAHEKGMERLEKLKAIAVGLTAQGIDVTETNALIEETQENLDEMNSVLDSGKFESAKDLLDEANGLMGQTTGSLQSNSNEKKKEKTERFIVKTKSMIQNLEIKLNRVLDKYNVSDEDADAIRDQFQEMKDKLDGLDLDEDDDLDDVIDDLKDIVKDSNDVGDDQDELDDEVVKSLKEINKHESKLERYKERVEALDLLGLDTTGLDTLVEDAEEALADALTGTGEGDEDAIEDLIDGAVDILDDLDDLIDYADDILDDLDDLLDEEDEDEDESDDNDVPDVGEDETGDDDSDEGEDGSDDNGNGGDDPAIDSDSEFDEVLGHVNYFIRTIQEKIDGLAEMGWETLDLGLQLSDIKESLKDVRNIDELVEVELEAWDLLSEAMSRQGHELVPEGPSIPDADLHVGDGGHPDDDPPDDDHDDDYDDHGDNGSDDHGDDDYDDHGDDDHG